MGSFSAEIFIRKGSCTLRTSKQRSHEGRISVRLREGFLLHMAVPCRSKEPGRDELNGGGGSSWGRTCHEGRCPPVRVLSCCKQGCKHTLAPSRSNQLGWLLPACNLDHKNVGTLLLLPTNAMKKTQLPPSPKTSLKDLNSRRCPGSP